MKNKSLFISLLFIVSLCLISSCSSANQLAVTEGMTIEELEELTKDLPVKYIYCYYVYEEENRNLVVKLSDDYKTVESYKRYTKKQVSEENLAKLEQGMSFYEVVKYIGLPDKQVGSGFFILLYKDLDDISYYVYFTVGNNDITYKNYSIQ